MYYTEVGAIVWPGISHAAMVWRRAANCWVAFAKHEPVEFSGAARRRGRYRLTTPVRGEKRNAFGEYRERRGVERDGRHFLAGTGKNVTTRAASPVHRNGRGAVGTFACRRCLFQQSDGWDIRRRALRGRFVRWRMLRWRRWCFRARNGFRLLRLNSTKAFVGSA